MADKVKRIMIGDRVKGVYLNVHNVAIAFEGYVSAFAPRSTWITLFSPIEVAPGFVRSSLLFNESEGDSWEKVASGPFLSLPEDLDEAVFGYVATTETGKSKIKAFYADVAA